MHAWIHLFIHTVCEYRTCIACVRVYVCVFLCVCVVFFFENWRCNSTFICFKCMPTPSQTWISTPDIRDTHTVHTVSHSVHSHYSHCKHTHTHTHTHTQQMHTNIKHTNTHSCTSSSFFLLDAYRWFPCHCRNEIFFFHLIWVSEKNSESVEETRLEKE
jgi:hypothetical protein